MTQQFGSATALVQTEQFPVNGARACITAGSAAFVTLTCLDTTGAALIPVSVRWSLDNLTTGASVLGLAGIVPQVVTQLSIPGSANMLMTVSRSFEVMQVLFQVTDALGNEVNVPVTYDLLRVAVP